MYNLFRFFTGKKNHTEVVEVSKIYKNLPYKIHKLVVFPLNINISIVLLFKIIFVF